MTADTANQFSGVSKSGVFSVGYSYDAFGRVNQIKRGTTAQSVLGFDGFDRLTSLANSFATAPSNINYGLAYTPANQLKSLTVSNASYDWPVNATNQARVADGLNRDAGIAALQGGYDLRGNLTNDGTRQYSYDTENRLISVAGPVTAGLSYDPAGRLRQTVINGVTTQFLYSGNDLIANIDAKRWPSDKYVLTTTGRTPISGITKAKAALDKAVDEVTGSSINYKPIEAWRIHDLRRTLATGFQRLGVRFEVTEATLNHVPGARRQDALVKGQRR